MWLDSYFFRSEHGNRTFISLHKRVGSENLRLQGGWHIDNSEYATFEASTYCHPFHRSRANMIPEAEGKFVK